MASTIRWPSISVGAALLVAACQQPASEAVEIRCGTDPEVEAQIAEVLRDHVAAHLARDAVGAAAAYTDDVWFRLDGAVEFRGRDAMVDVYESTYATQTYVEIEYTDVETLVCGDAAHVVGQYTETSNVNGELVSSRAQYMVLWRLQPDGSWKVSRGAVIAVPEGA